MAEVIILFFSENIQRCCGVALWGERTDREMMGGGEKEEEVNEREEEEGKKAESGRAKTVSQNAFLLDAGDSNHDGR